MEEKKNKEKKVKEKKVREKKVREKKDNQQQTQQAPQVQEKKEKTGRSSKKTAIILSVVLAVLALLAGAAVFAGRQITLSQTNLPNVYVGGIYVGGMTKEETRAELDRQLWDKSVSATLTVELPVDVSFRVDYTKSGANLTAEKATEAAYRYGHDGNWLENLFTYIMGLIKPEDVSQEEPVFDESYITKQMDSGIEKYNKRQQA